MSGPRINVTLDENTYKILKEVSKKEGSSISSLAKDSIESFLARKEDKYLSNLADSRKAKRYYSHDDAWDV